jgi:hypothetical protein
MVYRVLADLVVLAHFGFIVFVLLGGLLAFRWQWIPWLHVPATVWGVFVEFTGGICPLTPLENSLRRAGGLMEYSQGFVERYIVLVVYPSALTPELQAAIGVALVGLNLPIYGYLAWRRWHRVSK